MAANSIVIVVDAPAYDPVENKYAVDWTSITDDTTFGSTLGGRTLFTIGEGVATINNRIVNDAKGAQNSSHDAGLGALDPAILFGGRIGL